MAYSSFPFEGQTTTEHQYSKLFRLPIPSGVLGEGAMASLAVTANGTGMQVSVAAGQASLQGFRFLNDAPAPLTIDTAGATPRVDRVVLHLDPSANSIIPKILTGLPDGTVPALTQTDSGVYEIPLARLAVAPGTLSITQAMLTDERVVVDDTGWIVGSGVMTSAAGAAVVDYQSGRRKGDIVQVYFRVTLKASITVPSTGDVENTQIAQLLPPFIPTQVVGLQHAATGPGVFAAANTEGGISIAAASQESTTLPAGTALGFSGIWIAG